MFNVLDGGNACALGAAQTLCRPTSLLQLHDLPDPEIVRQKKRAPSRTGLFEFAIRTALLEAARDRGELGVQRGAQVIDDSDDRQRNAGGDQTVFNSGGAGFIFRKTRNEVLHKELQMSTRGYN